MGNLTLLHFKHEVTLDDVQEAAEFYAENRLGLNNAIFRDEKQQHIIFKQNIKTKDLTENDNIFYCCIKIPHPNVLEHSFSETGNVPFRKGLLDYIGWKLGASYRTEDFSDIKLPLKTFLTHPYIGFNGIPSIEDGFMETILHYILRERHAYYNEIFDIASMNKLCQFHYPYIENAKYHNDVISNKKLNQLIEKVSKTIVNSPFKVDYLFGDAIRCAIINSNLAIVEKLLKNNFLLTDVLDLSLIPHPSYISNKYLKEISLPILCLTVQCLSSDSFSPDYEQVIQMMIQRGANPYSKDYLGRDSLDYLLNTSHLQKRHKTIIFNEIARYFTFEDVQERILSSRMTEAQKEFYLTKTKILNWKRIDFVKPATIQIEENLIEGINDWEQIQLF